MPIRRLALDVDKVIDRPDILDLALVIERVPGVGSVNVTVTDIDIETVGMDITVEGEDIDASALLKAIEDAGAVVHSVDQVVAGTSTIERVVRAH
jgi:hypothetical protein